MGAVLTKKRKQMLAEANLDKAYVLADAVVLASRLSATRFDASLDLAVRLGIDPRKSDQMVRGTASLPHGTGKLQRVLVLCQADKEADAKAAGAEHVGLEKYIDKITDGWTDIDVVITQPSLMARLAKLGRVLGPRGLMPNPKAGTVTDDIGNAVQEIKRGKIVLKTDKAGIVHAPIGRCSFKGDALLANAQEVLQTLQRLKPAAAKGVYIRSAYVSATMGPSVAVDRQSISI